MSRANQWFVPGNDIAREVITADIQRYLGPDALVRPGVGTGDYQGQPGYWITAYRTLTSQMIQDLRLDSQRWQAERQPDARGGGVAYQDSRTHAARQHWGPTTPYEQQQQQQQQQQPQQQYAPQQSSAYDDRRQPAKSSRESYPSAYAQSSGGHYTTTPNPHEQSSGYTAATPRAQPAAADPYGYEQQPVPSDSRYQSSSAHYSSQTGYARTTPASTGGYAPQSPVAAPGYYIASDGRQYPLSSQPQTNPQPQSNRQGRTGYPGQQGR